MLVHWHKKCSLCWKCSCSVYWKKKTRRTKSSSRIPEEEARNRQEEAIQNTKKVQDSLNDKENQLNEDQRKVDEENLITESFFLDATIRLYKAIYKEDMLDIKLANEMLDISKKKCSLANKYKNAQGAARKAIDKKQEKILAKFVSGSKKAQRFDRFNENWWILVILLNANVGIIA